ncbi:MAG: protein kinase [Pseudomonadota bacterium]
MDEHCTYCGSARDPSHDKPWRCKRCGALVPWAQQPPHGRPIEFGPYTLVRRIAAGGMGVVYEAQRKTVQGFEKAFAVKRLLPALSSDRDFVDMIVDEAKICAQLEHPNIVQVFELDQVDREFYMAMEYVAGGTMATMLRFSAATRRLLPVPLVLYIVAEALKGLAHAHGSGRGGSTEAIIHRDVSPQNIMIGRDGRVKLTDFGIAKAMASSTVSRIGTVKGKLAYMAPELLSGQRATQRVDVFAMGVLLHEAFSSRRLFRAETEAALISTVLRGEIPPLARYRSDVPRPIEQVILGALSRDPTQRYPDARALRDHFLQAVPAGMLESGLVQSEKYIAEFYDIVGLPGEPLDPVNDAPMKGRRKTPVQSPAQDGSQPAILPDFVDVDMKDRKQSRWLLPAGIAGMVLASVVGGVLWLGGTPTSAGSDAAWSLRDAATAPDTVNTVAVSVDAGHTPTAPDAGIAATVDARARPKPRKLTVRDIERTFNKHMGALNACGAQHRSVLPPGGVKVALVIQSDGNVTKAVLAPTSIQGTGLDRCLSKVVARMRFPAHKDAEMSVTVPLQFQVQ